MPNWPVELEPKTKSAPGTLDAEREKQLTRRAQAERAAVMWRRSECMEGVRLGRGKRSCFCKCSMGAKYVASVLCSAHMRDGIVRWSWVQQESVACVSETACRPTPPPPPPSILRLSALNEGRKCRCADTDNGACLRSRRRKCSRAHAGASARFTHAQHPLRDGEKWLPLTTWGIYR